ncbi:MAG: glycerol-3-phosphate dehydrogenase/oxidase [Anaerolineae bacterium]|jgi:glycerol-3-phosphate dehydrogenase|nr:glycerol-3-phosphate dehydrogenase/oxidase [Anaerolineae bacterium]MBT7069850.1 glycerol-3-phosphate dehydrogenase/oxidase [Anaerolineae bacterium]MBT7324689.1 glycerol-3-phosphate dehydrogenase/oxidase [Anaerolineae bacterium]
MKRTDILSSLKTSPNLDVLIVGAGVNGIATYRDLGINGVNVLLVDRADFCSGASAASSHMAHGGIRYLENGEFGLVREAVRERNRMLQNAPHIVRPLPTTIPIFKIFSGLLNAPLKFLNLLNRPAERGAFVIKIGLIFYDAFTRAQKTVPKHHFERRSKALKRFSSLNPAVRYTATYYDGAILEPERLALEMLLDTEADQLNARSLNYVSVVGGKLNFVSLKDELTGEIFDVRPRILINAAGPWIDGTNATLGLSTRFIGGTKGSHLILDNPELRAAIGNNEFFFENDDGRIVLIYPLHDKVLVGTSDLPIENPDDARCTEEEIDYFIAMIKVVFPEIPVSTKQIVYRFSGVRPLEFSNAKKAGQISRDHTIQVLSGVWTGQNYPIYSLVGGKWTSFRAFAEEVTDKALAFLGEMRKRDTRNLGIGGGRNYERRQKERKQQLEGIAAWTNLTIERLDVLYQRYGTRVEEVALFISQGEDKPLEELPHYSQREIGFLATKEKVIHLDDLILRRTHIAKLGFLTGSLLVELADILAEALGWDDQQRDAEMLRTVELLADKHGVTL